jgi:hypothetical protein
MQMQHSPQGPSLQQGLMSAFLAPLEPLVAGLPPSPILLFALKLLESPAPVRVPAENVEAEVALVERAGGLRGVDRGMGAAHCSGESG